MRSLKHENILRFKDAYIEEKYMFIVTEQMEMDVLDYINIYYDQLTEDIVR